jgi:hypothetical protein
MRLGSTDYDAIIALDPGMGLKLSIEVFPGAKMDA